MKQVSVNKVPRPGYLITHDYNIVDASAEMMIDHRLKAIADPRGVDAMRAHERGQRKAERFWASSGKEEWHVRGRARRADQGRPRRRT